MSCGISRMGRPRWYLASGKTIAQIVPYQPVLVQILGAVPPVELAGVFVPDVYANSMRALFQEPFCKATQQFCGDMAVPALGNDIDPLQLAIAIESTGQASGDMPDR